VSDNVRDEYVRTRLGFGFVTYEALIDDYTAHLAERGMVVLGPDGEPLDVRPLLALTIDERTDPVDLLTAKPGDVTEVYEDVEGLTEFGWVAHLDYFDDYGQPVKVRRIRLRVLEREDIVLHADDDAAAEVPS
jgi:hypothetical protein